MRLTELQPRWLTPDVFIFRSPAGRKDWVSCKRIVIENQYEFLYDHCPDLVGQTIVGCRHEMCWQFEPGASFETLSVTPSIDGSASGNWHGYITNGEIVGGI